MGALLAACASGSPVVTGPDVRGFAPRDLIDVTAPDRIPVVIRPVMEPATATRWAPETRVVVVPDGASARAYPLPILALHQVVDDTVAGLPIAVTLSPAAGAPAVYERRAGARALTLASSGKVYRSGSVLFDRQTQTLWLQATGQAVLGPLKGSRLTVRPSSVSTYAEFRAAFPRGRVLARPLAGVRYAMAGCAALSRTDCR